MPKSSPVSRPLPDAPEVIARRFKTTLCRQHAATGRCKYVYRCMFAHGPRDLRTEEQNWRDGLTSMSAVAAYKEQQYDERRKSVPVAQVIITNSSEETAGGTGKPQECTALSGKANSTSHSGPLVMPMAEVTPTGCQTPATSFESPTTATASLLGVRPSCPSSSYSSSSSGAVAHRRGVQPSSSTPTRSGYRHNPYAPLPPTVQQASTQMLRSGIPPPQLPAPL